MTTATIITLALSVSAGGHAEKQMPSQPVSGIAVTVNGKDALYERITGNTAYVYGQGVIGKLTMKNGKWTLTADNMGSRKRTLKILFRSR